MIFKGIYIPSLKGLFWSSLGLQIAQSRYYLQTLDPKVGTFCILGALGFVGLLRTTALPLCARLQKVDGGKAEPGSLFKGF